MFIQGIDQYTTFSSHLPIEKKKRLISDNQDKQPINVFFVY